MWMQIHLDRLGFEVKWRRRMWDKLTICIVNVPVVYLEEDDLEISDTNAQRVE